MKNNVIIMMDNNKAQVSKTFAKNSKIYGSAEYKMWREFKAENPEYEMVIKTIKKNPDKETNKNLTYENMRIYISLQDNAKELLKEFDKQLKVSKIQENPYRSVLAWFKKKFKGYDSYKDYFKKPDTDNSIESEDTDISELSAASNM